MCKMNEWIYIEIHHILTNVTQTLLELSGSNLKSSGPRQYGTKLS